MTRTTLSPLTLGFHEPDHDMLGATLKNVEWQHSEIERSRETAVGASRATLGARARTLYAILERADEHKQFLDDWKIELNPWVDPIEVGSLYRASGTTIPPTVSQLMKRYSFNYLVFGGSLFVAKGATPKLLRLGLAFRPDETDRLGEVRAFDMFPKTEWRQWGKVSVAFGVNLEMGFKVPLDQAGVPFLRAGQVSADAKAQLIIGPLEFSFQSAEILGAGKGNDKVDWRITKGTILQGGDFEVYILLQVPKDITTVTAHAEMESRVKLPGVLGNVFGSEKTFFGQQDYAIKVA